MKIFIKHILRNLEDNIGRTLLILFTLFGVGLIVSLCITFIYAEKDFVHLMQQSETSFDYLIRSTNDDKLTYNDLEKISSDVSYFGFANFDKGYIFKDEYKAISLSTFDFNKADKFHFINGYENFSLQDNEIIIDKDLANKSKIKIGDEVSYYNSYGKEHKLIVKYLTNTNLSSIDKLIIVNENTYYNIIEEDNMQYSFFLGIYNGNEKIDDFNNKIFDVEDQYNVSFNYFNYNDIINNNINRILKVTAVVLILALVIVYFVLNSIVKIIMNERISIVGSFRSVGASNKKMNFILVSEMGLYGLVGGLLGSLISTKFTGSVFQLLYQVENLTNDATATSNIANIELYMIAFTTILLILFQISLSIGEILSFNKLSIKECMFSSHDNKYKRTYRKLLIGFMFLVIGIGTLFFTFKINYIFGLISIFAIFISIALFLPIIGKLIEKVFKNNGNPILSMAFNTINENKLQVSTNVIIAVLTSISIVAISFLNNYVQSNNSKFDFVKSDIYVYSMNESLGTSNEILDLENVESVASIYSGTINYDEIKIANNLLKNKNLEQLNFIYSDDVKMLRDSSVAISTDYTIWQNLKKDEVILSNYYKDKYNIKLNDIITIDLKTKEKRFDYDVYYDLKVVGFADTDNIAYNSIIVPEKIFADEITNMEQYYFINLKENKNSAETKKDIKKLLTYKDAELLTQDEYKDELNTSTKETKTMIFVIIGIIVGIGLIGIINNQTVAFLQRTKELAVLYSTCMSRKQLSKMILKELILAYCISALSSIFFALLINYLFIYTVDALGFYIPLKFNLLWSLALLAIVGIIMLLIYVVIKKKIKELNIVEELKYE